MIVRIMNPFVAVALDPERLRRLRDSCPKLTVGRVMSDLLRMAVLASSTLLMHAEAMAEADAGEALFSASMRQQAVAYEFGTGVTKDGARAVSLYCEAARSGDVEAQFALGWIYAYGRGVPRDDETAAFFFQLAAEQGIPQATNMLSLLPKAGLEPPPCMRDPVPSAVAHEIAEARFSPPDRVPPSIVAVVTKTAGEYGVPVALVWAIMAAESDFNPGAVSAKNAQGLMQLIPETAARFRVKNPFDPKQNVRGGIAYLRWLLAYFEGDVSLVAAAYNAGERAVDRYAGVPPYSETRAYVRQIVAAVGTGTQPFDANVVEPSPRLRSARIRSIAR